VSGVMLDIATDGLTLSKLAQTVAISHQLILFLSQLYNTT
jgi:hypothetical protein